MRVAGEAVEGVTAEDGEAEEDEGDEQPGVARGDQPAGGERRPRRRGRRGGRRRRGTELEDGLAGSIADELGPTPASEVTSAVADFDGGASEPAPSLAQADIQPTPVSRPAPVSQPEPISQPAEMQPAAYVQPEPVESVPAPTAEETRQEAERAAARRRSTVREKVSFVTSAPAEPAPAVSQSAPEPVGSPASAPAEPAPAASGDDAPRKAGWWSRRFGSGE
jgi:ribonuclease E